MKQIILNGSSQGRRLYEYCPLCDADGFELIGHANCKSHPLYSPVLPETISWQRCRSCGHIFTDGYFEEEVLDVLFSKANKYQLPDWASFEKDRFVSARIVEKVSRFLGESKGKWLDVGFGNGSLITTAEEFGFEPVGIDLRQEAVKRMQELGYEVYCLDFTTYNGGESISVISMADVLEHMPFPRPILSRAYDLLKRGGVLFISCPNVDSFLWRMLDEAKQNGYWQEIEHYHNFGRKRLYAFLSELGFTPVNYGISERYRVGMEIVALKRWKGNFPVKPNKFSLSQC